MKGGEIYTEEAVADLRAKLAAAERSRDNFKAAFEQCCRDRDTDQRRAEAAEAEAERLRAALMHVPTARLAEADVEAIRAALARPGGGNG